MLTTVTSFLSCMYLKLKYPYDFTFDGSCAKYIHIVKKAWKYFKTLIT